MDTHPGPVDQRWLGDDGFASFHDVDTEAEVDAAFRSQRRIAASYCVIFLVGVLGVAAATVWLDWSTTTKIVGGFSPSFLMAGVGLYLFFVVIGVAAASLANGADERMLGASSLTDRHQFDDEFDVAPDR